MRRVICALVFLAGTSLSAQTTGPDKGTLVMVGGGPPEPAPGMPRGAPASGTADSPQKTCELFSG